MDLIYCAFIITLIFIARYDLKINSTKLMEGI